MSYYFLLQEEQSLFNKLVEQAKKMEKQQIIMDYEMGYINGRNKKRITGEQYYNETYAK